MEAIFSLKFGVRTGSTSMPNQNDLIRWLFANQCESDTNWYDAVRCNQMQHDGDTMQYEAVRWWWRINTIALWCDENTIGTNRNWTRTNANMCDPIRQCDRYASYCSVLSRSRQAANPGANVQRIDTTFGDAIRRNTNRLRFAGPIRMFWTFQNIRIGLRTNTKVAAN